MADPIPTLPGSIPGLLRVGSVVTNEEGSAYGVIFGLPGYDKGRPCNYGINWQFVIHATSTPPDLDLRNETSRAHAAWWTWGRGSPPGMDLNWSRVLSNACHGRSMDVEDIDTLRRGCLLLAGLEAP